MSGFRAFFGDRERTFRVAGPHIAELEAQTGVGIGTLMRRVTSRDYRHRDLTEIIRIGLIGGGGAEPAEAARLVETYALYAPIEQTLPIALGVIEQLWFGASQNEVKPNEQA